MPDNAYLVSADNGGGRATKTEYTFNTDKKDWDKKTTNASSSSDTSQQVSQQTSSSYSSPSSGGATDKTTSKGKADKTYKETEMYTLVGDVEVVPNAKTIKIKSGDTIEIKGIGKYLSGQYFVDSVARSIDNSNGYSHSLSVLKTGFGGSSLKGNVSSESPQAEPQKEETRPEEVKKEAEVKTYTMVKGDTLIAIARKHYGDANMYKKIAEANGITEAEYTRLPIGKELKLP